MHSESVHPASQADGFGNPSEADVLIIGAGLAGLTAALHVAERGLKPIVLEANPKYVGGRVGGNDTVEFEHRGHILSGLEQLQPPLRDHLRNGAEFAL